MAVLTKAGSFLRPLPSFPYAAQFPVAQPGAQAIAVDGSGNLYLCDSFGNRVIKYTSAGSVLGSFGSLGSTDSKFGSGGPTGVAVDASGNIYVCDSGNLKVKKFNSAFVWQWTVALIVPGPSFAVPTRIATDGTHIYVTSAGSRLVFKRLCSTGAAVDDWGGPGSGDGQFTDPSGIAVSGGNVYVCDQGNSRIQKFTTSGTFLTKWGSSGSGNGQFNDPIGVAVDPVMGLVFVADRDNDRIQVFTQAGVFVTKFGSSGSGNGQFTTATDIAANPSSGDLSVLDVSGSSRAQRFTLSLQTVVTGLGFQPKGIIWLGSNNLTAGTWRANAELAIGLTGRLTSGGTVNTKSLSIYAANAEPTPAPRILARDGLRLDAAFGVVQWQSESIALDADGFTIAWDPAPYDNEAERVAYLAFGESVDARAFGSAGSTVFQSTDAVNSTKTQTFGDSFLPSGAIIVASDSAAEAASFGVAAQALSSIGQWAQSSSVDITGDPTQAQSVLVNDAAICLMSQTGTVVFKAVVDSWNSSGITYRVTLNTLPVGLTVQVHGLAINGAPMQVGTAAKDTGAAPDSQVIATDELPKALLLAGGVTTSLGTVGQDLRAAMGVSDGTTHATSAVVVEDNVATSDADTVMLAGKAFVAPSGTPPNSPAQATAAFNVGNVTLTWNPNNGSAYRFGWLTLLRAVTPLDGDAAIATSGPTAALKFNHTGKLLGTGAIATSGPTAALKLQAKLSASTTQQIAVGGPDALLSGQAVLEGAAHLSIGSATDFAYLVESHILTGGASVDVGHKQQPGWLGTIGGVGTHILSGEGGVVLSGDDAELKVGHQLGGAALLTILATHTWPPEDHPLSGAAEILLDGTVPLLGRFPGDFTGAALLEVLTSATPAKLGNALMLTGTALVAIGGDSLGLGGADLPIPKAGAADDLVGTINLCRNPSFELDDEADVFALNGATTQIVGNEAWHGTSSLEVTLANLADSGVTLRSLRGLPYTGAPNGFLGQFRVHAASEITDDLTALVRVVYTDSTDDEGEPIVWSPTPDAAWHTVYVPVVVANAAKQVDYLDIAITRPAAVVGQTIYLDGVQHELDRGGGHTPFAIGTYGEPYHRWWGGAHASVTIRDAIPLDSSAPAMQGEYRIEPFLFRANADNTHLEDLSRFVVNAVVTADARRDVSWTLECEMLAAGWAKLTPFVDWLAPVMEVTMPDGRVRRGQLGHFVVLPSPRQVDEWGERVQVDGRSGEILLQMQGTKGIMQVRENTKLIHAARVVLDACHLGEAANGKARHDLPDDGERAHRDMTWEKKEDAGQIVNDLLRKAGKRPLYASKTGVLRSVDRKKRRLKKIDPQRVWGANLPPTVSVDPWIARADATTNEVVGQISLTPDLGKWDDNKIVVVSVNPRKPRIRVVRYINDPDNPVNPRKRKRIKERKVEMDVGTNADAERLAEAIAEEIGTKLETVELAVLPDPEPEFLHQVVYLAIYSAKKEPVAVGRFAVHSVTYGWTADEALMQLNLGFVHSVDQLAGGSGVVGEIEGLWNPL